MAAATVCCIFELIEKTAPEDLLISDLAPIDLLLQRAGRLWRHPGRARPLATPRLLVVSPDPSAQIGRDWYSAAFPRAAYVYQNHALLWLSATALF
jgi:CRISPR-associated endonuclease/helicase Cas3